MGAGATGLTKYTVPILFDTKNKAVVNNESSEIVRMLNTVFNEWAKYPERDIYPERLRTEIDAAMDWIYPTVNNGVYRCGFAKTQEAYKKAHTELFASLDKLESHFSSRNSKFLTSHNEMTWIDLRLYQTLVRFDPVYVVYFKTNYKSIGKDYPNLLKFVRSCYAIPEIKASTNMKHIKTHYFTSHPTLNTYGIIPESNGPDLE